MPGLCHAWVGKACLFVKKSKSERTECSGASTADPLHRLLWVYKRKCLLALDQWCLKNKTD